LKVVVSHTNIPNLFNTHTCNAVNARVTRQSVK